MIMGVTILSLNAKGLNHPAKHVSLWKLAIAHNCDVLCVQETHFALNASPKCQHGQFTHVFQTSYPKKQQGVLIAIRNTVSFQLQQYITDPEGRYIFLTCTINNVPYTLVSIYAPNQGQMTFLKKTLRAARKILQGHMLLCGDFNLVPNNVMDSTAGNKRHASPLDNFIASNKLYDVWRCCHVSERDLTFLLPCHNTYS